MTMKMRSINASKGLPVNYCSGFRSLNTPPHYDVDGNYIKLLLLFIIIMSYLMIF